MILEKIAIKDYKSIDSLEWNLTDNISCLVGQNESGKSNLLQVFDYIDSTNAKKLKFEEHTRRGSERYNNQSLPYLKYCYKFTDSSRLKFFEELKKYKVDIESFGGIESLEEYVIEIEEKEIGNQLTFFRWNKKTVYVKDLKYAVLKDKAIVPINPAHQKNINLFIENLLPKIIGLNEQDFKVSYSSTLENLKNGNSKNSSLFKLMRIAGLNDSTKIPIGKSQIRQYLKGLNRKLNQNFVRKYYSQDESVKLEFVHDSGTISLDIEDNTDGTYEMEERSDGFKYFFSLLIEMASNGTENENVYFLLDEPGGRLHPSGQRDLLKYLEELAEKHKIIYTTHSPFLINRLFPNRVRIVDRDAENGTVFKFKGFSKNWKPMRSSLGLNIKDSFYYSDKALIVEGPEDLIFISSLVEYFNKTNQLDLNTDLFSFIDAGGESNLPAMVQIIMDDERPTLVLIDSDSTSTYNKLAKKVEKVNDKSILDLIEIKEFKSNAVSIEDLLPYELLEEAVVNYCLELENDKVFELKEDKKFSMNIDLSKVTKSRYNNEIAKAVKDFYKEVDLEEEKWNNKKTPISKVGIARYFEILLLDEKVDKSKMNFKPTLNLIKTVASKLGLLN